MTMTPRVRMVALTIHVTASVGWLGAVAAFLALSIAGLTSGDAEMMRGAYLGMQLITWAVIIPLSGACLVTGVIQSLGTAWGLFRHYWVVAKLVIAVAASILLLLHTQPIQTVAAVAAQRPLSSTDLRQLRIQLVADAIAALVALAAATTLSVFKPQGLTRYGRRKQYERTGAADYSPPGNTSRWRYVAVILGLLLVLLFVLRHVTGPGLGAH